MKSVNPANGQVNAEYPEHTTEQVEQKLAAAELAKVAWRAMPMHDRGQLMHTLAGQLRLRKDEFAALMTTEMGKTIVSAESEVEKCAVTCEFFAENAGVFLLPREIPSDAAKSYVRFDPLGVVLAIMPWNFPFWQVLRFAAPALMAGNVAVLKHAPNVPGCAMAVESLFIESGFPVGVFTSLLISDNAVAQKLASHPAIAAVTLTGSERAGAAVASEAGAALKKTVMELGGSDPFIVLADVDVNAVARTAAEARCINNGQSCIAAKRFIVEQSIASKFESALAKAMFAMRVGDPMNRSTQIGPLARKDLVENLHRQVEQSIARGAKPLTGGRPIAGAGYFYPPTVLSGVRAGMPAFDEETFGPVAAVIRAASAEEAIQLANQSRYGLGASIWTRDIRRAEQLAEELNDGCVFINGIVKSDARLPFGGVKCSGWGRELSEFGIHEFVNVKTVWIGAPA